MAKDITVSDYIKAVGNKVKGGEYAKAADPLVTTVMNSVSLRRELATEFIDLVVDESKLLGMARRHMTDAPSGEFSKINVTGHITEKATENSSGTETRRPTDEPLTFNTVKMRMMMDYTGEWEEDNIEGSRGVDTFTNAMIKAMSNDMETLAIEGDTSETGVDDRSRLIKANDGWHVLTQESEGAHIVDASNKKFSFQLATEMLRKMPTKWKRNPSELRWMMSWQAAQSYLEENADRTILSSDEYRRNGIVPTILGIPVEVIYLMPEDLAQSGTDNQNGTFVWLTKPDNFIYVVQRDLRAEWERVPRSDSWELTVHMRTDYLVEVADAVVKATNVSVYADDDFYGAA